MFCDVTAIEKSPGLSGALCVFLPVLGRGYSTGAACAKPVSLMGKLCALGKSGPLSVADNRAFSGSKIR